MPASRPRRKAKQERARQTVDTLLEAAAQVLLDRGYAAATTNRIATRAGVSVGTLYEYFANKEELFQALIQRELDAIVRAVQDVSVNPGDPVEQTMARGIAAAMGAMRYGPELVRCLEQVPEASFRRQLADARRGVVQFVEQLLASHRDELRVPDLPLAAFMIVSAAEGIGANATREQFGEGLADELAAMVRIYLTTERTPGVGAPR